MTSAPLRLLALLLLPLAQPAWCDQSPSTALPGASPHINQPFEGARVERWSNIFERPGREVFDQRYPILEATRLEEGMRVADIGAGTGLFATLFARAVGPAGVVYAIDVSPGFVAALSARARAEGLTNLVPIRNSQQGTGLRDASVDLAFVCDTYHHFENPGAMLASIHRALAPGGTLIIIDYERLPGASSPWILGHVRAGRDQVVREVTAAGFRLVEQPEILRESYFLRFQRTDGPAP
ncbi:MAG: methyltransferase domain-containing protein [Chromatiaceae bacterium]